VDVKTSSESPVNCPGNRVDLRNFFAELLVVIVLFKRKTRESSAYTSLHTALNISPSFPEIFIYDNSPFSAPIEDSGVIYFHDPKNSGVSKAYNNASVYAGKKNKKWMLFLDQDTSVELSFFEKLQELVVMHPESVALVPHMTDVKGVVSPFYFASGRGKRMKNPAETLPLEKYRFINSGLLIRQSAFVAAGGYDEEIPLDFSDIAFGQRLKKVTDHFRIVDTHLQHQFSDNEIIPVEAALARFNYFRIGAFAMGKNTSGFPVYFILAFMRACHLCFRYKDFRFLTQFFQRPIHG
jgi:glycosyltransferase involved in cell wall biosynthesis